MVFPRSTVERFVMRPHKEDRSCLELGRGGEEIAIDFLSRKGFCVIAKNFRGRNGEIDIIALDGNTVCFVEVKTRRSLRFGEGYESVVAAKQQKIMKTALLYLKIMGWSDRDYRFDVISITFNEADSRIEYFKDAFEGF